MKPAPLRWLCAALLLAAALFVRADDPPAAPRPLQKGDALLVDIGNLGGGLPAYREIVDSQGNIELPYLGLISADGKTPEAVATEMAAAYATAGLASNAAIHLTIITHFEPPPARESLVRIQDPRQPAPAANLSAE